MDEIVTKKIHISGLTPAITAKDLSDRLGSFGTVKSIDGYGLLDAVGQPRKFAYATLETTKGKLARCMNLLSGVTWKGTKLRLGEAKPNFREKIAQEHAGLKREAEGTLDEHSRKRRRLPRGVQGVHALDQSLITPENASTRGGWHVTPTGRLIRPVRMRPTHPLPPPLSASVSNPEKGKSKKRPREPPTRARRKTIDPTKWGSQHLKGIFLENAASSVYVSQKPRPVEETAPRSSYQHERTAKPPSSHSGSESEEDVMESFEESDSSSPIAIALLPKPAPPLSGVQSVVLASAALDLTEEKSRSLGLLQSLFGDKDQWGGAESIESDIEDETPREEGDQTFTASPSVQETVPEPDTAMEVEDRQASFVQEPVLPSPDSSKTKLKDLFAPHEEDTGFSLLGHLDLDLDLELEDDVPFDTPGPTPSAEPSRSLSFTQPSMSISHVPHTSSLDPSRPFFFPSDNAKGRVLDPTNWRTWFYRTDSHEAIRARWEETKGELTAGWKRRHREAVKSRRRRGGGGVEAD